MSLLAAGALATLAKGALTSVVAPFVDEARNAALNAAEDTLRTAVAGRMSIKEWADIVIVSVDKVKEHVTENGSLRFVGGKIKFAMCSQNKVSVSFQLYFLDELGKWHKAEADSLIPSSKFTYDALDDLGTQGEIVYEVE